jgi:hypothetical protein
MSVWCNMSLSLWYAGVELGTVDSACKVQAGLYQWTKRDEVQTLKLGLRG